LRPVAEIGDLALLCQMIAGCSSSAAAFLTQVLPSGDDGTHFLIWFWDWLEHYLEEKGTSFDQISAAKVARLGVVPSATVAWQELTMECEPQGLPHRKLLLTPEEAAQLLTYARDTPVLEALTASERSA
jgi:hypothetical protein